MTSVGIDYGLGMTNIDHATGIRYGCISQHSILQSWSDSSEPQYPEYDASYPSECPNCGQDITGAHEWGDQITCACGETFDLELPDYAEPYSYTYDSDGYLAQTVLDSDVLLLKSPYYTFCQFCSPCVPGAGNLDNPIVTGIKTYAFGHDWFDEGEAPYPVYRVSDDKQVVISDVPCERCNGTGERSIEELAAARHETRQETEAKIRESEIYVTGMDWTTYTFDCAVCQGRGMIKGEKVL